MRTESGHEFEIAWNQNRGDVVFAIDAKDLEKEWIKLTPEEAIEIGNSLLAMAETCNRRKNQLSQM
jgi:hypothetical protein